MNDSPRPDTDTGVWVSPILRLAIASLFLAAAVSKLKGGMTSIEATVATFQKTFEKTWLPMPLVTAHAYAVPFIEAILAVWLVIGCKLKAAWTITALYLITLAFGMSVAGQHAVAGQNYVYVVIACFGLYFSKFDRCCPGRAATR